MKRYSILFLAFICLISCKKKEEETQADFDREAMLENIGNNIILPSYQTFYTAMDKLDSATVDFNTSPDATKLTNLQNIFKDAYIAWQACSIFEFGPAQEVMLRSNVNTFPVATTDVETNISSGSYDLRTAGNLDAKGLPGIDYLLFGSDNSTILANFTTDGNAAKRKEYLQDLVDHILTKDSTVLDNDTTVLNAWLPGRGNYLNTFITSDGTDIGSSVGYLVNQLNADLEITKNYRLGLPLGKQSTTALPEKVEAYYSGISSQLALLHIQALENVFLGRSSQGDGMGFDDYLDQVDAQYNGTSLSSAIKNQFTSAITKLQAVPDPLSTAIQNNPAQVNDAYVEIQKLVVLLKAEMPSKLGILITYVDNDGD